MKKRLSNIELLRIVSMIMILELHLLRFGNILDTYNGFSMRTFLAWFLESLCFVAVNCYVIISGYFLIDSKFTFKKIINLLIQVLFYSLLIYFTLFLTNKIDFSSKAILKSFFPIFLKNYWFVTIYVLLYMLSPFLNKLLKGLNQIQYRWLIIMIFLFFSLWPTIFSPINTSEFGGSYSISWFICLYIIAGYLKIFYGDKKTSKIWLVFIYLILSIINVVTLLLINKFNFKFITADFLYNYYSITVVLAAIALFLFFNNLEIKNKTINKLITFFASTTFGVYLIHENPNLRLLLWSNFYKISEYTAIKMLLYMIIIPILLFILFALIEKMRILLFKILSKINLNIKGFKCYKKICEKIKKMEENLCQK